MVNKASCMLFWLKWNCVTSKIILAAFIAGWEPAELWSQKTSCWSGTVTVLRSIAEFLYWHLPTSKVLTTIIFWLHVDKTFSEIFTQNILCFIVTLYSSYDFTSRVRRSCHKCFETLFSFECFKRPWNLACFKKLYPTRQTGQTWPYVLYHSEQVLTFNEI